MRVIHKYVLDPFAPKVSTYEGARFIHATNQREEITVWAEVNTLARECVRTLHVVGTGYEPPQQGEYVGTVLMSNGDFVFHIYAEPEATP